MTKYTTATWAVLTPLEDAQERAQALCDRLNVTPRTIEFVSGEGTVIRTVTVGEWTIGFLTNGKYPLIPGEYTDSALGSGAPAEAVFKANGVEVMRMSCFAGPLAAYALLADIVAGVPIRRGPFVHYVLQPKGSGQSEPILTTAPAIAGQENVGELLTATPGAYSGNPVPTITGNWYRGTTAIAGATQLTYRLAAADEGSLITYRETAVNSVNTLTASSNALGPIRPAGLSAALVPNPIQIDQGGSFNFDDYLTGGTPPRTVTLASGSLPTGITKSGNVLNASADAPVTLSGELGWSVQDSAGAVVAPVNSTAPTITGGVLMGSALSASTGAWSNQPTSYAYQWRRNGVAISGATGPSYTTVSADIGATITVSVTATNAAGSTAATSAGIGPIIEEPVSTSPPVWTADPVITGSPMANTILAVSSGTVVGNPTPTRAYQWKRNGVNIAGATDSVWLATEGAAVTCTVTASNSEGSASVTTAAFGPIGAYVPADPGALPEFGVLSAAGGSNLPFAFGHVFKKGDIPSGQHVNTTLTDWQYTPLTYWPDGSLRHAIVAGRANCVAGVATKMQLSRTATARTGTALTEANLSAVLPAVVLTAGSDTITLGSLVGTSARHRTVCTGPVMSNWIYRKPIAGSNHLVAWFDVRLYVGGRVEIFPWIENGFLLGVSCPNDIRTYTLTIAGVQKFSAQLDIKHHTRNPLIDNTASTWKHWSYWTGADPQIDPVHDATYMQASKMVPNYGWPVPESSLSELSGSFRPCTDTEVKGQMSTTSHLRYAGYLPPWTAKYIAGNADIRAYRTVVKSGLEGGAWGIHYRDATTNEPYKFSDYPTIWNNGGSGSFTRLAGATGGNNTAFDGITMNADRAHQPSVAYVPWLVTARWFYLDEMLFWATWSHADQNYVDRDRESGILKSGQVRARARVLRNLSHTLVSLPATHPLLPEFRACFEANAIHHRDRYVTGTIDGGRYANNLGVLGAYSGWGARSEYRYNGVPSAGEESTAGYWWASPWMMANFIESWGMALDLELPISPAAQTAHAAVCQLGYKLPVGFAGADVPGDYPYRWFACFQFPIGQPWDVFPGGTGWTWTPDYSTMFEAQKTVGWHDWEIPVGGTTIHYANPGYDGRALTLSDWNGGMSAVMYAYSALTLAVAHGAPGAAAAWDRISKSASFFGSSIRSNPAWATWPRNLPKPTA